MFDVGNKIDLGRLHKAKKTSRDVMELNFRHTRTRMISRYAGSFYTAGSEKFLDLVNMLNQTARVYMMALAFNNPQVKITSFNPKLWPFCRKWETNVNRVVANIDLKTTFQEGLLDAFFLMGVFKVRMAETEERQILDNVWIDPGKPWVDRVSFDNLILDMSATDLRAMRFCGDRYRVAFDKVRARDDFDRRAVAKMSATSKFSYDTGSDYASQIASGGTVDDDELEPMVWLEDVYLPETDELITLVADNDSLPPLKVERGANDGPMGPFEFLRLGIVPDNVIPSSPSQNLFGLHLLGNRLYRKLAGQANREKDIIGFLPGHEDDAKRGLDAQDGETVKMRDPKALVPMHFGGVDGNTHAFFLAVQEVFNAQAGNPRALAGLGREADTLGQEEIIESNAKGMIASMKGAVNQCAANICRKIGALMWDDEYLEVESTMEAENTGYFVDSSWRPGEREGLKDNYEFSVEPNSMGHRPPEMKVQAILQYVQQVGTVFPLVQAGVLDIQELTRIVSEYQNVPELQRIFKFAPPESIGVDPKQATKPAVTSRETVRLSRSSGPTPGGMAEVAQQMMQGGGKQSQGARVGA